HLNRIKLPPNEEKLIENLVEQPLGIIILGQNCLAKASVVNELFGQPLLPTLYPRQCNQEERLSWRMVRFSYGTHTQISLALANSYELVEHLIEQPWHTIPAADLEVGKNPDLSTAVLEIRLRHALLRDNVQVVVSPSNHTSQFNQVYRHCVEGLTPILIYCFKEDTLTEKELEDLISLKKVAPKQPVFFVCSRPMPTCELTESEQHARSELLSSHSHILQPHMLQEIYSNKLYRLTQKQQESRLPNKGRSVFQQLCGLGYLSSMSVSTKRNLQRQHSNFYEVESELIENFDNFPSILLFIRHLLQSLLIEATTLLNESHNRCLRMFVLTAFDMTRDMLVTPKRLEYTRQREAELYSSLMTIASKKQEEIRQLIVNTIEGMKEDLLEEATNHQFQG
ncbi:dual serine/threonine and tyrosine protein kinase-like, partial [Limulus polyphemus]|uniref:Dual serine/threonine and tyrosine protein kinase-like n=1 Tax=Limulus polyphemus TaxID=6850 RepID=A0ABM1RZ70_LIMPO